LPPPALIGADGQGEIQTHTSPSIRDALRMIGPNGEYIDEAGICADQLFEDLAVRESRASGAWSILMICESLMCHLCGQHEACANHQHWPRSRSSAHASSAACAVNMRLAQIISIGHAPDHLRTPHVPPVRST
jgi:hypothetical protein